MNNKDIRQNFKIELPNFFETRTIELIEDLKKQLNQTHYKIILLNTQINQLIEEINYIRGKL